MNASISADSWLQNFTTFNNQISFLQKVFLKRISPIKLFNFVENMCLKSTYHKGSQTLTTNRKLDF